MLSEFLREAGRQLAAYLAQKQVQLPAPDGTLGGYRLGVPQVYVGWLPPGMVLGEQSRAAPPCVILGAAQASADNRESRVQLTLTAAVYDPGHQLWQEGALQTKLGFEGYQALLTLLEALQAYLLGQGALAGWELSGPVTLCTNEEQPWPYWYGRLEFAVEGPGLPLTRFADLM